MNFTELVNAVITDINRPDMGFVSQGGDGQIPQAVVSSTLKMHGLDFFYKDIKTARIIFDTAAYIHDLDLTGFARFRSISYVRKDDPSLASYQQNPTLVPPLFSGTGAVNFKQSMHFLKILSPDDILDSYGVEKLDVAFQAGDSLYIKSSSLLQYALIGWYAFPNVDTTIVNGVDGANFYSWIARDYPYAIVYDASSAVLQSIGETDASRAYMATTPGAEGQAVRHRINLVNSSIVAVGY